MSEAPQAALATYLNELWCHRTTVMSRRLTSCGDCRLSPAEPRRLSPSYLTSLFVVMAPWLSGRALLGL